MNSQNPDIHNGASTILDRANKQTELISVREILSGDHYFRIPDYQRGYAWSEKEIKELWEDVLRIYRTNSTRKHYTGMLSLEELSKDALLLESLNNTVSFYVVDGQQRLTTIIIFINFILEYLKAFRSYDLKDYQYILKSQKNIYRFGYSYARKDDAAEFFEKRIYKKNENLNNSNQYLSNLDFCANYVEDELKRYECNEVKIILDLILDNLIFNVYFVNEFDVRLTFETMNNRGKQLSSLEILKNRLMYLSTYFSDENNQASNLRNAINSGWKNIYDNLCLKNRQLADDDYLKAHWIVYHGIDKNKGGNFVSEILDYEFAIDKGRFYDLFCENSQKAYDLVIDYVDSLSNQSLYWAVVNTNEDIAQYKGNINELNWIKKLYRLSNILFLRACLMVVLSETQLSTRYDRKEEFYKKIEKFVFLNKYIAQDKNDLSFLISVSKDFFTTTKECKLEKFEKIIEQIDKHDLSINENRCVEILKKFGEYINGKKNNRYYYDWNGLYYFLYEYNESLTISNGAVVDWFKINVSVEHILPQEPKYEYWQTAFHVYLQNVETRAKIINSLGNLLLLSSGAENSSLSNHSFPVKKDMSVESGKFAYCYGSRSAQKVAKSKHWTPKCIYERSKELLEFLYVHWFKDITNFTEQKWWHLVNENNLLIFDYQYKDSEDIEDILDKIDCAEERKQAETQLIKTFKGLDIIDKEFLSFFPKDLIKLKRNKTNISYLRNVFTYVLELDKKDKLFAIKCGIDLKGRYWINYNLLENKITVWSSVKDYKDNFSNIVQKYLDAICRYAINSLQKEKPKILYS